MLDISAESLTVERVEEEAPSLAAAVAFGRGLARMHAAGAAAYGSPPGVVDRQRVHRATSVGAQACLTGSGSSSASCGCGRSSATCATPASIDAHEVAVFERVCDRLGRGMIGGPDEPPSRLHGDLWNGNVLWSEDGAVLIDPAAHGGHRESDLAMLALFGLPYLEPLLAAYHEVHPLADGWRKRVGLHQLYPLLVHAVLFGRGYAQRALTIAVDVLLSRPAQPVQAAGITAA